MQHTLRLYMDVVVQDLEYPQSLKKYNKLVIPQRVNTINKCQVQEHM